MERLMSLVGIIVILSIGFALSNNKKKINWRTVGVGLSIQFGLGILLLGVPMTRKPFEWFTTKVAFFLGLSSEGTEFIFGPLADVSQNGYIFAVQVLPTIIFFSAFISIMYYLGVIQLVIQGIALVMRRLMGTSGSETLSCSANIFVGQTEAPLLIRPFLDKMTYSELNAVMVGGFATIAGGVLAAYIGMGIPANHLIVASVMAAPGALAMGKLVVPETEHSETAGDAGLPKIDSGDNVLDAAARGTSDGLKLAVNVAAMLIAFISLIAVVDWVLGGFDAVVDGKILGGAVMATTGEYEGYFPGSLQTIFGTVFAPFAFLLGVPWSEAPLVGNLIGQKICVNEFVAYFSMQDMMSKDLLSDRSIMISTYALCGFANFSSIGIQIGGIGALAPERRGELSRLALRAMTIGVLVSCLTACIAGLLVEGTPPAGVVGEAPAAVVEAGS